MHTGHEMVQCHVKMLETIRDTIRWEEDELLNPTVRMEISATATESTMGWYLVWTICSMLENAMQSKVGGARICGTSEHEPQQCWARNMCDHWLQASTRVESRLAR